MNAKVLLGAAIDAEVTGTMSLRAAVDHPGWYALVIAGYLASFTLLGLTLRAGMAIGVVYGFWGATGVALTAALGAAIFGESLTTVMIVGIGLIIAGVVLIETGSKTAPPHDSSLDAAPHGAHPASSHEETTRWTESGWPRPSPPRWAPP